MIHKGERDRLKDSGSFAKKNPTKKTQQKNPNTQLRKLKNQKVRPFHSL